MIEKLVSEAEWNEALADFPAFSLPSGPIILLAPHPDDESLAVGGLLAALANKRTPLTIVAVTDGDAAYSAVGDPELAHLRCREQTAALAVLGVADDHIRRFSLPDRCVHEQEAALTQRLVSLLKSSGPTTTLIAPWRYDFHSDHEAVGRAAEFATAQVGVTLIRWFWWSWHHRTVAELTKLPLKRFSLEPRWHQLKMAAIAKHRSQLGEDAILSKSLLVPAYRNFEVFA